MDIVSLVFLCTNFLNGIMLFCHFFFQLIHFKHVFVEALNPFWNKLGQKF